MYGNDGPSRSLHQGGYRPLLSEREASRGRVRAGTARQMAARSAALGSRWRPNAAGARIRLRVSKQWTRQMTKARVSVENQTLAAPGHMASCSTGKSGVTTLGYRPIWRHADHDPTSPRPVEAWTSPSVGSSMTAIRERFPSPFPSPIHSRIAFLTFLFSRFKNNTFGSSIDCPPPPQHTPHMWTVLPAKLTFSLANYLDPRRHSPREPSSLREFFGKAFRQTLSPDGVWWLILTELPIIRQ